jgi:hypothetical protein
VPKLTAPNVGKDPVVDAAKMRQAALLIVQGGKTDKEIARDLNISVATLRVFRDSDLFREQVATISAEVEERGIENITDALTGDTPENLRFVKNVRSGWFADSKERIDIRLKAAKMLLDKQVPNADAMRDAENAGRIVLSGKLLGQMLRAMKNSGAIDIDAMVMDEAIEANVIPEIAVRTPGAVAAELKAQMRRIELGEEE